VGFVGRYDAGDEGVSPPDKGEYDLCGIEEFVWPINVKGRLGSVHNCMSPAPDQTHFLRHIVWIDFSTEVP
jgi:hypothetical protein